MTERLCDGIDDSAPPRPGASSPGGSDGSSCGFKPAVLASRSPRPSKRITRACRSPSLSAIALRWPCTFSSPRAASSRWSARISFCRNGSCEAAAHFNVTKLNMNVNARNSVNSENPPTAQCRQSSVTVRARAVAPVTRMMFNRVPSI